MLKPTTGNVAIRIDKAEETFVGGLIVPEQSREVRDTGVVVAVSDGIRASNGNLIPHGLDVGDHILLAVKYAGASVEHEGETLVIVPVSEIAAVIA